MCDTGRYALVALIVFALLMVLAMIAAPFMVSSPTIEPASPASPAVPPWNALTTETETSQPNAYTPRWRARTMPNGWRVENQTERV